MSPSDSECLLIYLTQNVSKCLRLSQTAWEQQGMSQRFSIPYLSVPLPVSQIGNVCELQELLQAVSTPPPSLLFCIELSQPISLSCSLDVMRTPRLASDAALMPV